MSIAQRIGLVGLWALSIVAVGVWTHAQTPVPPASQASPIVISGSDLGFRVVGQKGGKPMGTLVVRINGQWVETESPVGIQRLTTR